MLVLWPLQSRVSTQAAGWRPSWVRGYSSSLSVVAGIRWSGTCHQPAYVVIVLSPPGRCGRGGGRRRLPVRARGGLRGRRSPAGGSVLAAPPVGLLPGGGSGAKPVQPPELVAAERGQVRLDLAALGRLRLLAVSVEHLRRLSCLLDLRRCPTGVLPVEGRRAVEARAVARGPRGGRG